MGQDNDESASIPSQLCRWKLFIDKWEKALEENKETLVLGDTNMDFLKWNRTDLPPNDSSVKLKSLKHELFTRVLPQGVAQMVTKPTRSTANDGESGLDHIYSNISNNN